MNLDEKDSAGVRGNAGLYLVLIATDNIEPGQVLKLNLPGVSRKKALLDELKEAGQPMPDAAKESSKTTDPKVEL